MYYISSYETEKQLWGVTDTEDKVEEFYNLGEICKIVFKNKIPILGGVNGIIVGSDSSLCRVIGVEYFEFMNKIKNFILKHRLANSFTYLDESGSSPRVIEITDLVNEFAMNKGFTGQLYLFNKSDTVKIFNDGLYLVDSLGRRKLAHCVESHVIGLSENNSLVYGFEQIEIGKRYFYDLYENDILWSYRKTYQNRNIVKYCLLSNMKVVYKSKSSNALF